jgi:acetolactate synthase I/II/III large subunit
MCTASKYEYPRRGAMRIADYAARTLADRGVSTVFAVAGGHIGPLLDAVSQEQRIKLVFCHHEQAAAIAAEGYARPSGRLGVCLVTAGPGAINALGGVFGAWTDSVPVLALAGQCRTETIKPETVLRFDNNSESLRQLGDQEVDTERLATPVSKYAIRVYAAGMVRECVERALHAAVSGRPGPCWLEFPVNVQSSEWDVSSMQPLIIDEPSLPDANRIRGDCRRVINMVREASRPVIFVGSGVRTAKATDQLARLASWLSIPVVTAFAPDAIRSDHPCFVGRQGTVGDRVGNWAVQCSDLLLVLGSRLSIRQVGYDWEAFAPKAKKVWVDVDRKELEKPTVKPDVAICCDLRKFLDEMQRQLEVEGSRYFGSGKFPAHVGWKNRCLKLAADYLVVQNRHRENAGRGINHYYFLELLWSRLATDDVVVCGNSTAAVATMQVAKVIGQQRLLANSGSAAMGWGLPAAIGAAVARGGKRVVLVTGDGSIMMNLQELATVKHHRLPIKIFVLCNGGYASIRQSQQRLFGRVAGADPQSGVSFPEMLGVAEAFGIEGLSIFPGLGSDLASETIGIVLREGGPMLCVVRCDPDAPIEPRVESRRLLDGSTVSGTLEDMAPHLPGDELARVMEMLA